MRDGMLSARDYTHARATHMGPPAEDTRALTLLVGEPATGKTTWARNNQKTECYNGLRGAHDEVASKLEQGWEWHQIAISTVPDINLLSLSHGLPWRDRQNCPTDEQFLAHLDTLWPGRPFAIRRFEHKYV